MLSENHRIPDQYSLLKLWLFIVEANADMSMRRLLNLSFRLEYNADAKR